MKPRYDNVELEPCVWCSTSEGERIYEAAGSEEQARAAVANGEAEDWCWSVYWHCTDGGVESVADFDKDDKAGAERLVAAMMCAVLLAKGADIKALEQAYKAVEP